MTRSVARFLVLAGLAALAGGMASAWAAGTEFALKPDPGAAYMAPVISVGVPATAKPDKGLPKLQGAEPLCFEVRLGPNKDPFTIVLDSTKGANEGYDRLFADTNGDGSLSDEKPFEGTCHKNPRYTTGSFVGCKLQVKYGDGALPWAFNAHYTLFQDANSRSRPYLAVSAGAPCEGTVDFGGKKLKVALVDGNTNGCFGDFYAAPKAPPNVPAGAYTGPPMGDWILVDANGDGRYDPEATGLETFGCGKYLVVDGTCYEVNVSPSGRKVAVAPSSAPCGTLKMAGEGPFAVALLTPSDGMLAVASDGAPVKVPAGSYRLHTCAMAVEDDAKALWRLTGRASGAAAEPFEVKKGETAVVKFGAPLKAGITAMVLEGGSVDAVKPDSTVRLSLSITGQGGEGYSAGSITKAGARLPPPAFTIRAKDGKEVASGSFQYG